MAPREVCLLLVLDVIELLEDRELDLLAAAAAELARRSAKDGRPMDAPVRLGGRVCPGSWDGYGLDVEEAAAALHLEGLAAE